LRVSKATTTAATANTTTPAQQANGTSMVNSSPTPNLPTTHLLSAAASYGRRMPL